MSVEFAQGIARATAALALCLAAAGCASVSNSVQSLLGPNTGPNAPRAAEPRRAAASGAAVAPASVATAPAKPAAPVEAATQRAFDAARAALAAGRRDEAERGFRALATAHPELGGPAANLGAIARQDGRRADAVAALEQAVKASPNQAPYWNQLGVAYRENGQFDQAASAYERAIALDPHDASPLLNLAILDDLYRNDTPQALALYERYLVATTAAGAAPDATVKKWIADLRNRKPATTVASKKEPS